MTHHPLLSTPIIQSKVMEFVKALPDTFYLSTVTHLTRCSQTTTNHYQNGAVLLVFLTSNKTLPLVIALENPR